MAERLDLVQHHAGRAVQDGVLLQALVCKLAFVRHFGDAAQAGPTSPSTLERGDSIVNRKGIPLVGLS